ncbi:DUF995 domain-containing protein [Paracoccus methylarcula]|uniref:DUF995 domain-containing protein n=1 Tax=Paracoccus methylarcula TaxID=72022 RepID=A0A3R7LLI1_9RHOB|nr:DUF995 domain-containing protein [Paracoccus methylarcula]RNF35867.1 DUF995 domain-containing protein [Paracoccus methylarcula]
MNISETRLVRVLLRPRMLMPIVLIAAGCAEPSSTNPPRDTAKYPTARFMTVAEIQDIYKDKSWQWDNGVGYMKGSPQLFSAWSEDEAGKTWAEGRWLATNSSRMCFDATWHVRDGTFPDRTCFSHRVHEGTVYQKREPDGEWYIFRHAPPRAEDEASKLIPDDLVSEELEGVKAALASARSSEQRGR